MRERVFKIDSKGKTRVWQISVDRVDTSDLVNVTRTAEEYIPEGFEMGVITIEAGLLDGKKVTERIEITEGKNLGKSNATTPYTQALAEAKAKLELKLRGEYVANLSEVRQAILGSGISAPMLAQKYHPKGEQKGSKTLDKMKIRGEKIHVQPKYDGNRCLIKVDQDSVELYTRKGDRMLPVPHIEEAIRKAYDALYIGRDDYREFVLDGELFAPVEVMSFNTLNGLIRKEDKSDEQKELLKKVNYHLYDMMTGDGYAKRYRLLEEFTKGCDGCIKLVPSYEIVATDENIKEYLELFLAEGHEGLMIRTLHTGYENKRSWQLCKVKLFEDAEFEVIDLELDVMGRLGKFIMKAPVGLKDRDGKPIETFKAGTTGITHEEGLEAIKNKDKYIGKMATVEYFGLSEYGVPRFPKFKGLRAD